MSTAARLLTLALLAALTACGSTPTADEPTTTAGINEPAPPEPASDADEYAFDAAPPVEPAEVDEEPSTAFDTQPEPARPAAPAELGRPDWWFTGIERDENALRVCAEGGGASVRDARRAAIEAARRRLALEADTDPTRERIKLATVLPLPAADAGPGAAKYIGYVLMEVPAP